MCLCLSQGIKLTSRQLSSILTCYITDPTALLDQGAFLLLFQQVNSEVLQTALNEISVQVILASEGRTISRSLFRPYTGSLAWATSIVPWVFNCFLPPCCCVSRDYSIVTWGVCSPRALVYCYYNYTKTWAQVSVQTSLLFPSSPPNPPQNFIFPFFLMRTRGESGYWIYFLLSWTLPPSPSLTAFTCSLCWREHSLPETSYYLSALTVLAISMLLVQCQHQGK